MSPTPIPTRITIDFRDSIHPSRMWILGVDGGHDARIDLVALGTPLPPSLGRAGGPVPQTGPAALMDECECPDFCQRDHANE